MTQNIIEHGIDLEIGTDYYLHDNYIGTSFSLCVKSLIKGEVKIDQVIGIESSTKIETEYDLDLVIEGYKATYWEEDPEQGERLARDIFSDKIFYQPRVERAYYIIGARPIWLPVEIDPWSEAFKELR